MRVFIGLYLKINYKKPIIFLKMIQIGVNSRYLFHGINAQNDFYVTTKNTRLLSNEMSNNSKLRIRFL
jgi:hypothetical protein